MNRLTKFILGIFEVAPHLPSHWKVWVRHYLASIMGLFAILILVGLIQMTAMRLISGDPVVSLFPVLGMIGDLVVCVLLATAYTPLSLQRSHGVEWATYALLLYVIIGFLGFYIWEIALGVVGLYLLSEVADDFKSDVDIVRDATDKDKKH